VQNRSASGVKLELFLLSIVSLYIELLIIRWLSADMKAFTVFRTFPLIACFVGLGVGFALGKDRIFRWTPYAVLLWLATMRLSMWYNLNDKCLSALTVFQWNEVLAPTFEMMLLIPLFLVGPFLTMTCIGARLGFLLNQLKPLSGYGINLLGSLIGSAVFSGLAFTGLTPWQLLMPACILIFFYLPKERTSLLAAVLAIVVIPFSYLIVPADSPSATVQNTYWSPYQRIDLSTYHARTKKDLKAEKFIGLNLSVNHAFHQYFFLDNLDEEVLSAPVLNFTQARQLVYNTPFQIGTKCDDVLIVGAGTGQNVNAALSNGAKSVDAVEIDPVILKLGKQYNQHYVSDPRVHLYCDDARHFISGATHRYDRVVFSLLDSHTVAGQGSSVRLDCYVYTEQSIQKALSLLKPNGLLVISFLDAVPWMGPRLQATFEKAAGYPPLIARFGKTKDLGDAETFFIMGDAVRKGQLSVPQGFVPVKYDAIQGNRLLTDDWPYLYVQSNIVDVDYLSVVFEILMISIIVGRKLIFGPSQKVGWQMFFLGAAFIMLELHAISFLSLAYGSTWITSAIVINGILVMIFLANLLVLKFNRTFTSNQNLAYGALAISILASYFLPGDKLIANSNSLSVLALVTVVTLLPMACAGVIFATAFSQSQEPSRALAFNLFGAVLGGMLEYISNFVGIKNLELIALALYLASFLSMVLYKNKMVNLQEQ
jgi:SAM-dependent methyltransferase